MNASQLRTFFGLAAACMAVGCSTVVDTKLVVDEEQPSGATEERGKRQAVLSITVPEPPYVAQELAVQNAWREADYEADRKRDFRSFEPATSCRLPLAAFQAEDVMTGAAGPFFQVELREMEQITVSKNHEVVTRSMWSNTDQTNRKTLPIFSYWRWPDALPGYAGEIITVTVEEFAKRPGAWNMFAGKTDSNGELRIPLAPLLDTRSILGKGTDLTLLVECPSRDLEVEITLPYDVIAYFAQLQHRTR